MSKSVIVVSGGNGSIGRAIVKRYIKMGCSVVILDITQGMEVQRLCKQQESNCTFLKTDLTDPKQIQKAVEFVRKLHGRVNHLISVAGGAMPTEFKPLKDIELNVIDRSIRLNLNSHIYLCKLFLPLLEKGDGDKSIVMVSSINAFTSLGLPAYSSCKAGLYGFMHSMSREFGKSGIRINTVSPGTVLTPMTMVEPKDFNKYRKLLAVKRFATTTDIANAVFSLTNVLKAITGQNLVVDAGQSL